MIAAIAVAGVCFVLIPLRSAFPPVPLDGWLGRIFGSFLSLDQPYNLLPSLHAALGVLLFDLYFRRTCGALRAVIGGWFFLIALSPLLTHQHQVTDIVTGMALAGYCFYAFPSERTSSVFVRPCVRIASFYCLPAIALCVVVVIDPRDWGALLWIAVSLGLASVGYLGLGPRVFRKTSTGTIPLSSLFVMGPCIFGQYLSLCYYRRKGNAFAHITPSISMGRRLNNREAAELCESGVTAVLDLSAELSEVPAFRGLRYRCVPVLDLTAPSVDQLEEMARFIAAEAEKGQVYVHCKIGYSRSAAAIAAYMLLSRQAGTVNEAEAIIRQKRPMMVISPSTLNTLEQLRQRVCVRPGNVVEALVPSAYFGS